MPVDNFLTSFHAMQKVSARIRPARLQLEHFFSCFVTKCPEYVWMNFPSLARKNFCQFLNEVARGVFIVNISSARYTFFPCILSEPVTVRNQQITKVTCQSCYSAFRDEPAAELDPCWSDNRCGCQTAGQIRPFSSPIRVRSRPVSSTAAIRLDSPPNVQQGQPASVSERIFFINIHSSDCAT
jgi:hypothetical protein